MPLSPAVAAGTVLGLLSLRQAARVLNKSLEKRQHWLKAMNQSPLAISKGGIHVQYVKISGPGQKDNVFNGLTYRYHASWDYKRQN